MSSTDSKLAECSSALEATVTDNMVEEAPENMENNEISNKITILNENTTTNSDDGGWWEIEKEDLVLDPATTTITTTTEQAFKTTEIKEETESVTSRLLRKRDELAKKYGIAEKKNESMEKNDVEECVTRETTLEEFKEELRLKRLARQTAVQDLRNELHSLRSRLTQGGLDNEHGVKKKPESSVLNGVDTDDEDPIGRSRHANIELANAQLALQLANAENLTLQTELGVVQKQVVTLKEVISCCKQMLAVKEEQWTQLKGKLDEIESSLGERELKLMSSNLRAEYERQLGNIRQLRELYEERQRISAAEHENLQRLLSIKRDELQAEQEKTKNVEERNQTLLKEVENANKELTTLREECNEQKFEKKALKEEMGAVNTLFSQMVTGFNGRDNLDIDRLTTMLEENRTLLNDMATKEMANDGATLPKLLFELVEQVAVASGKSGSCLATNSGSTSSLLNSEEIEETVTNNDVDGHDVEFVDNGAKANVDTKTNIDKDAAISVGIVEGIQPTKTDVATTTTTTTRITSNSIGASSICYVTSVEQQETANLQEPTTISTTLPSTALPTSISTSGLTATKSGRKHYRRTTPTKTTDVKGTTTTLTTTCNTGKTMKISEPEVIGKVVSTQEIIGNLPKVWKVLMELLSHHKIERVQFEENGAGEDCYKSVQTPSGIKTELSVSKTYIKLKVSDFSN